jgi:hypothetical protein
MKFPVHRSVVAFISGVLALAASACGGSSPGAPSPAAGATLIGTVETGPSAASVSAASVRPLSAGPGRAGITVTVVGSSTTTTTDDSGRFVLTGLPAGSITLHFEGNGVSGQVVIDGLVAGQTLTIAFHITVSGTTVVKPGEESEVEFKGAVESVTPLKVAGRTVMTDANTRIRGRHGETIALSALHVGDVVHVEGMLQADGTILARSIKLEDNEQEEPEDHEVELEGAIQSKGANSIKVANRMVVVDGKTRIVGEHDAPLTFAALQVGQKVEVEGMAQPNGDVLATKIEVKESDD